jgi:hypothetical protein
MVVFVAVHASPVPTTQSLHARGSLSTGFIGNPDLREDAGMDSLLLRSLHTRNLFDTLRQVAEAIEVP